jgi:hypothetical protein
MIIGICGKMGTGKDFIASNVILPYIDNILHENVLKLCFADQIKVNVMAKHQKNYKSMYEEKSSEDRKLLQIEGTENGRNVLGKDVWVNYLDSWIKVFSKRGVKHFVVTDVRFQNELDYIKKNGGLLIKVFSPTRNNSRLMHESGRDMELYNTLRNHASECDLDNVPQTVYNMVINNEPGMINEKVLLGLVDMVKDHIVKEMIQK